MTRNVDLPNLRAQHADHERRIRDLELRLRRPDDVRNHQRVDYRFATLSNTNTGPFADGLTQDVTWDIIDTSIPAFVEITGAGEEITFLETGLFAVTSTFSVIGTAITGASATFNLSSFQMFGAGGARDTGSGDFGWETTLTGIDKLYATDVYNAQVTGVGDAWDFSALVQIYMFSLARGSSQR